MTTSMLVKDNGFDKFIPLACHTDGRLNKYF